MRRWLWLIGLTLGLVATDIQPNIYAQRVTCGSFASQAAAQAAYRADPIRLANLDEDQDGIACESRPAPRDLMPLPVEQRACYRKGNCPAGGSAPIRPTATTAPAARPASSTATTVPAPSLPPSTSTAPSASLSPTPANEAANQTSLSQPATSPNQIGSGIDEGIVIVLENPPETAPINARVEIRGWAINPEAVVGTGVSEVAFYLRDRPADGGAYLGSATYGQTRLEVAAVYGPKFEYSGFTWVWDTAGLTAGDTKLVAIAIGENGLIGIAEIAVRLVAARPIGPAAARTIEPLDLRRW